MSLPDQVKQKLQELPDKPGVYLMRDKGRRIIYVGKAASLRNRVRHYFQQGTLRSADPKLRGLIRSIADFDFLVVRTEAEAILTEGRMIKEYRPRYNVSFRDDKRFLLLRIHPGDPWPRFEPCRLDKRDGATYFGPYSNTIAARAALEFVERRFGLRHCRPREPGPDDHRHCHADIVRFCSAPCVARITPEDYRARVADACAFLHGERPEILNELQESMKTEAEALRFEKAAALRDTLLLLRRTIRERARGTRTLELKEEDARAGVAELQQVLNLPNPPRVIECFDISNISGTHAVASMVCAVEGMPARQRYRRFRIKTILGSDDPGMMAEVIRRRYRRLLEERASLPDLVLVDGGITQLRAARAELAALGLEHQPSAGLAKRLEEIYWNSDTTFPPILLPHDAAALKILQRIRDEAHRFALDYHRRLRARLIRDSVLDEVEGIGAKRKEVLLRTFGSVNRMRRASEAQLAAVPGVGPVMARAIRDMLDRTAAPRAVDT
jgi:excinuclease ABC subunit C